MSLTSLIDDRHGPVREFFETRLPDLRAYRARWRAAGPLSIVPTSANPAWGIVGAAIDYRIRYLFDAPDPATFVASHSMVDFGTLETEAPIPPTARANAYGPRPTRASSTFTASDT